VLCLLYVLTKDIVLSAVVVFNWWHHHITLIFIIAWVWSIVLWRLIKALIIDRGILIVVLVAHQNLCLTLNLRLVILQFCRLIPRVVLTILLLLFFLEHIVLINLILLSHVADVNWCLIVHPYHDLLVFYLKLRRCHHHVTCTVGETREIIFGRNVAVLWLTIWSDTSEGAWLVHRRHVGSFQGPVTYWS